MWPRGNSCTAAPASGSAPPPDVASFGRFGAEAATFTPGPAGGAASIGVGAYDLWNGRIAAGTIGIGAGVLGMASDAGLIKAGTHYLKSPSHVCTIAAVDGVIQHRDDL